MKIYQLQSYANNNKSKYSVYNVPGVGLSALHTLFNTYTSRLDWHYYNPFNRLGNWGIKGGSVSL